MLVVMSRSRDEYRPATRVNALQQGTEILAAHVAREAEVCGAFADPVAHDPRQLNLPAH
jgi:hypothetical protein